MAAPPTQLLSIAQLTRRIKQLLESEVGSVWVSGEISNWKVAASGHAYFTLKDAESQIDAVLFRPRMSRLGFDPKSGLEVIAHGAISVYERRGNYQLIIDEMQPKGLGALQLALEQLKQKLDAEGLFAQEHKKPLPMLPRRIGIVTSPTGAAIRDILHVLDRRFANLHILVYPARVQGEGAAAELAKGIQALDRYGVDVIIVGRGGGSLEDLWPFNEEVTVRAVFAAKTPVISAVGHEIDYALTDFAADCRAPTPSAAAELVVRERAVLIDNLGALQHRLTRATRARLDRSKHRLALASASGHLRRPEDLLRDRRQACDEAMQHLEAAAGSSLGGASDRVTMAGRALTLLSPVNQVRQARERFRALRGRVLNRSTTLTERSRARLNTLAGRLDALSPLAILSRGYALAWKLPERTLIRSAREIKAKDELYVRFGKGSAHVMVTSTEEITHAEG